MKSISLRQMLAASSPFVLTLALMGGSLLTPSANAATSYEITRDFFSDATHSTLVGSRVLSCDGDVYGWGDTTEYKEIWYVPCSRW